MADHGIASIHWLQDRFSVETVYWEEGQHYCMAEIFIELRKQVSFTFSTGIYCNIIMASSEDKRNG